MVDHGKVEHSGAEEETLRADPAKDPSQCCPFVHRDLLQTSRPDAVIAGKKLLNALHYIHFMNNEVLVHADDPQYSESFLLRAQLDACLPDAIGCRWAEDSPPLPEGAQIRNVIVSDGLSLIIIPASPTSRNGSGFTTAIPEQAHLLGKRCIRRYPCRDIGASLSQNAFQAEGELVDISALSFRIRLGDRGEGSLIHLNVQNDCTVTLRREGRILFSGNCRILRQATRRQRRELVLAPIGQTIHRFQKKKVRNLRLQMSPPPVAHFEHPLSRKPIRRDIRNISFAGFAVEEVAEESVLLPGMVIPGLEIRYAGIVNLTCDCQVIYRRPTPKGRVVCGLAILDMDFRSYRHLSHIMVHAGDPQACFSSELDMDALWEFFFNTGFIYPKKYHLIQSSREQFKSTYSRLYNESQEIEAHFTYAENGRIYGHVSIFRAYQRAWMVHHLAARPLAGKRTGLSVLKNVLRFFDGLYHYPSVRMDQMIFYFRPENHFPNLFFGGFARALANPRACSLDLFAYMSEPTAGEAGPLPAGWELTGFRGDHFPALERFYRNTSGGLLLEVLRLEQPAANEETLEEVYRRHGFLRRWHIHSLVHDGALKALLVENHSEPGLNLSELLNGIKIVVIDPAGLPWSILSDAVARLKKAYAFETIPLLIYPATYPADQGRRVEKHYQLWILNTQHGKDYLDYMEEKTKLTFRFLVKYLLRKLVPK